MQLGFMNLILTVIVQEVANAREKDHDQRLKDKKSYEQACFRKWEELLRSIDADSSGTISKTELMSGFDTQTDVRNLLTLLDIDEKDLERLFDAMDLTASGEISYTTFFDTIRRAHSQDMRTGIFNLSLQVSQLSNDLHRQVKPAVDSRRGSEMAKPDEEAVQVQKVAGERDDILSSLHKQVEELFQPSNVEQKLARERDTILNSLHKQLEDRLEQMSQEIHRNTAKLRQNAELLEAALSRPQLKGEVRAQTNVDSPVTKKGLTEFSRSGPNGSRAGSDGHCLAYYTRQYATSRSRDSDSPNSSVHLGPGLETPRDSGFHAVIE